MRLDSTQACSPRTESLVCFYYHFSTRHCLITAKLPYQDMLLFRSKLSYRSSYFVKKEKFWNIISSSVNAFQGRPCVCCGDFNCLVRKEKFGWKAGSSPRGGLKEFM
ncbi:hypothetical protein SO802_029052 [Lithocarpus litseifolius]|uniref:Uncharacterized protein n=1 Tax=Lithocarpus litseifolius TaxID=425828 RepID=A0AAW2BTK7_9ROSI